MKHTTLTLLIAAFIISCSKPKQVVIKTKEEIAKDSVMSYLQGVLHDPSSYELVSFSNFDTMYRTAYQDKSGYYRKIQDSLSDKADEYYILSKEHDRLWDLSMSYYDTISALFEDTLYRGDFMGYRIWHKYRAKNAMGALTLHQYVYIFDTSMVIIDINDLDD